MDLARDLNFHLDEEGGSKVNRTASQLFVVVALSGLVHGALAREATPDGLSAALGVEQNFDSSVALESDVPGTTSRTGHLDIGLLGNVGDLAFGGGLAWAPGILGNGRLLLGGRLGWQPTVGRTRIQLLGEGGMHRFDTVGGDFFSSASPPVVTMPYVGVQMGMTRTFVERGRLEYGISIHVRQDLDRQTVVNSGSGLFGDPANVTTYRVGGTMLGATLTLGFRVDTARRRALDR
jgi:hypothetical protein